MFKAILLFFQCLPDLMKLIKTIQASIEENKIQNTVKENVKKIDEAFKTKNADEIRNIFNS